MNRVSNEQRAEENFPRDVSTHELTIKLNSGVYRHLSFRRAGEHSWNMWFDIVTWPGFLCICGDMGTWTFARLHDMFEFFRDRKLRTNPSYWAEKLQNGTSGGRSNAKEWDEEEFTRRVLDQLTDYYGLEGERLAGIRDELTVAMSCESGNGPYAIRQAVADFVYDDGQAFRFDPCEMPDGMVYSFHFLWCLYAIVWGIQQFDTAAIRLGREDKTGISS